MKSNLMFTIIFLLPLFSAVKGQKQVPVTVETSTVVFMDELDAMFYSAAINFINFRDREAAIDINKAVFFIELELEKKHGKNTARLQSVKNELFDLVTDLNADKVEGIQRLKRTFARTHYSLSESYIARANESNKVMDNLNTIYNLNAASSYLILGVKWIGHEVGAGTRATRKSINGLVIAVNSRNRIDAKELNKVLQYMNKEIKKFGNKLGEKKMPYDEYEIPIYDVIDELDDSV